MSIQVLKNKRIVLVSTVPYFMVTQLSSQIKYFASLGMDITVITSEGKELLELAKDEHVHVITINIPRKLKPWGDLKALWKLIEIFRQEPFDILHSFTPKAGLLCAIAGWLARIPLRFHTFTGQAWVTRQGLMRSVMRSSDRLIVRLMQHCYADSQSQCDFLVAENIGNDDELSVMGHGSLGGVDTTRFSALNYTEEEKKSWKVNLGIQGSSCIYIYIGRMTVDKGLKDLLDAFESLQIKDPKANLLLVGPVDEDGKELIQRAKNQTNVHFLGYQEAPEHFLAISDILCLPSYREGFGTVVIEAAAMGLPCIGTKISGLIDAIDDQVTGLLVPVKDSKALTNAMRRLGNDKITCEKMGKAACQRAMDWYSTEVINLDWNNEYVYWLKK